MENQGWHPAAISVGRGNKETRDSTVAQGGFGLIHIGQCTHAALAERGKHYCGCVRG